MSEDEEVEKVNLVEEILQQGDTAIIYPEAPEDEQSPVETGGADENGIVDTKTCYCLLSSVSLLLYIYSSISCTLFSLSQAHRIRSPSYTRAPTAPGATSATPR